MALLLKTVWEWLQSKTVSGLSHLAPSVSCSLDVTEGLVCMPGEGVGLALAVLC